MTWATPKVCPTRATHESTFWPTTVASGSASSSPRHQSQAPHEVASNCSPKCSASARWRQPAPLA